jgi:S1-C subfamily serine protease
MTPRHPAEHSKAVRWLLFCIAAELLLVTQSDRGAVWMRVPLLSVGLGLFGHLAFRWREVTTRTIRTRWLLLGAGTGLLLAANRSFLDAQALMRTLIMAAALWFIIHPLRTDRRIRRAYQLVRCTVVLSSLGVLAISTGLDVLGPLDWMLRGGLVPLRAAEVRGVNMPYAMPLPDWLWFKASSRSIDESIKSYLMDAKAAHKKGSSLDQKQWSKYGLPLERGLHHVAEHADELVETTLLVNPFLRTTVLVQGYFVPGAGAIEPGRLDDVLQEQLAKQNISLEESFQPESEYEAARVFILREHGTRFARMGSIALFASGDTLLQVMLDAPRLPFQYLYPSFHQILNRLAPLHPALPRIDASVLKRVKASTAFVLTPTSTGSGFVLSSGTNEAVVVTNAHVVASPSWRDKPRLDGFEVVFPSEGDDVVYAATLIGTDREADLALLRVKGLKQAPPPLRLRVGEPIAPGTPSFVVGFPFGYRLGYEGQYPTPNVNAGWTSLIPWPAETRSLLLPIDVGINPGNSGGPMVDEAGDIIGVAVAHLPGSKLSFAVSPEAVLKLARAQSIPFEPLTAVTTAPAASHKQAFGVRNRKRYEDAMVVVEAGGARGPGVVVRMADDRRVIITPHDLIHDRLGARYSEVKVTFHPETDRKQTFTVEVLRSLDAAGVAALSVPLSVEIPDPPMISVEPFRETNPVEVLGFRQKRSWFTAIPLWRPAAISGQVTSKIHGLSQLRIDAGVNHMLSGGPLITPEGTVVGFALDAEPESNVMIAVPAQSILEMLGGAVSGGALRYTYDGGQQCFVQFDLVLDDPFHQLKQVGASIDSVEAQDGILPTLEEFTPSASTEVSVQADGNHVALQATLPCRSNMLAFQLWTERDGKRRQELRRAIRLEVTSNLPQRIEIESLPLSGDVTPSPSDVAEDLFVLPAAWLFTSTACEGNDSPECSARLLHVQVRDEKEWSELLRSTCVKGISPSCAIAGKEARKSLKLAEAEDFHGRACQGGVGTSCAEIIELPTFSLSTVNHADRVTELYEKGCNGGDPNSCYRSGERYLYRGSDKEMREMVAAKFFARGCSFGSGVACRTLGKMIVEGHGMVPSPSRALRTYTRGCELGDAESCMAQAGFELIGRGTAEYPKLALRTLQRACKLGHEPGCRAEKYLNYEPGLGK